MKPPVPASRFLNRELSDLAFIERVVEESINPGHPLLERLGFLAISSSVLDQFYTVRVARLHRKIRSGNHKPGVDGTTPTIQLRQVNACTDRLITLQQDSWTRIRTLLADRGIHFMDGTELDDEGVSFARKYFDQHISPVISPFIIDREHPFPYIPSGGLCVVAGISNTRSPDTHLLIPIPSSLPGFIRIPAMDARFVSIEALIIRFMDTLFTESRMIDFGSFQILRDNDLTLKDRFDDLREMVETGLQQRDRAHVIRLKFARDMSEKARRFVARALGVLSDDEASVLHDSGESVTTSDTIVDDPLIGFSGIMDLISESLLPEHADLAYPPLRPKVPERIRHSAGDYFAVIRDRDLMLHWPYDDFDVLAGFIMKAALDPDVVAIKQTLYRTSNASPVVNALIAAAESGKSVIAVVELEARDNEKANIVLARKMEAAGIHIVYGIVDLKVHCKLTLVVRREDDESRRYAHIGTGNYHPVNARIYTDLAWFTCDEAITGDVNRVFNYLTSGYPPGCRELVVAPADLRKELLNLIDAEIGAAGNGEPTGIWAKLNALTDPELITKLYEASEAGVPVELVVRRQCRLKPGVRGLSGNIRVKSIVGRFLEHSRIYCFANGHPLPHDRNHVYIASADWMERNFDDRVEIMAPVRDPVVKQQILLDIMQGNLKDTEQSWFLDAEGGYRRLKGDGHSVQDWLMRNYSRSGKNPEAGYG